MGNPIDIRLRAMENRIRRIYQRRYDEISEKWTEYLNKVQPKIDSAKKALDEAKTPAERREALREYQRVMKSHTIYNDRFKLLVKDTSERLARVTEIAQAYINDQLPKIYAVGYNSMGKKVKSVVKGFRFDIVSEDVVKRLATKNKTLLPYKKVNKKKAVRWNTKRINSEVMQGILQGEDIPKISKRLENVTEMNRKAAVRNARTAVTGAENAGRMDMIRTAEESGVKLRKKWVATKGARTRDAHREMNGQVREIDEPFTSSLGKIMYPGDPTAKPANVYNCRCTLSYVVSGFEGTLTDEQKKKAKFKVIA